MDELPPLASNMTGLHQTLTLDLAGGLSTFGLPTETRRSQLQTHSGELCHQVWRLCWTGSQDLVFKKDLMFV